MEVIGDGPEELGDELHPPPRRHPRRLLLLHAESLSIAGLVTAAASLFGSGMVASMGFVISGFADPSQGDPYAGFQVVAITHGVLAVVGGALGRMGLSRANGDVPRWATSVASAAITVAVVSLAVAAFIWLRLEAAPVPTLAE
jgi:hypothetical protein